MTRDEYPEIYEWQETLRERKTKIDHHHRELDRAYHCAMHVMMSGNRDPQTDNLLLIIYAARLELLTMAPATGEGWKGVLHPSVEDYLRPALSLCNQKCRREWLQRGFTTSIKNVLSAVMLLGAIFAGLRCVINSGPQYLSDPDCQWLLRVFKLRP